MSGVSREEVRSLFLFESLDEERLDWLAEHGSRRTYGPATPVYREGEPAAELFVLLEGALRMTRTFGTEEVQLVETAQRGAYAGAVRSYVGGESAYANTVTTTATSAFFVLPAPDFAHFMQTWSPMAVHLLDGLYLGLRNSEATMQQREHLARLGALSADLAHELNNPAGAAVRATGQLRERLEAGRAQLGGLDGAQLPAGTLARLVACQHAAVERAGRRPAAVGALEEADREDAIADRLDALGVPGGYELAAAFADAGLDADWVDEVAAAVGEAPLAGSLRWLAASLETASLLAEIEEATGRISTLVAAVKQYSYRDSASVQDVDVHVGLDSTVTMLGRKLQGVHVERDYDRSLPHVPVHAAELNQVWTNLIDNAAHAMGGEGRLLLRTRRDGDDLVVEVGDDGPGIPEAVQDRVFEPYFTTKAVGEGTGLGLDNARRIVEKRHRGHIGLTTGPGGTVVAVRLPLVQDLA